MEERIFIAFLGTGNYERCAYALGDKTAGPVVYVQSALLELLEGDFSNVLIFVTSGAKERHWEKLRNEFGDRGLPHPKAVDIPDGASEGELWEIFQTILDNIPENARLTFDMTHSFRSLPILFAIVARYATVVKKASLEKILYGAFEAKDGDNPAPVFDITPMLALHDWSAAVEVFDKYGEPGPLVELTQERLTPIMKATRGRDAAAKAVKEAVNALNALAENIKNCRGREITNTRISEAAVSLDEEHAAFIPPLAPLMSKILKRLRPFTGKEDARKGFEAVEWCVRHGLTQQGYTLLQETFITILTERFGNDLEGLKEREKREFVSSAVGVVARKTNEDAWNEHLRKRSETVRAIAGLLEDSKEISGHLSNLIEKRNDMNHGGFISSAAKSQKLKSDLEVIHESLLKWVDEHPIKPAEREKGAKSANFLDGRNED